MSNTLEFDSLKLKMITLKKALTASFPLYASTTSHKFLEIKSIEQLEEGMFQITFEDGSFHTVDESYEVLADELYVDSRQISENKYLQEFADLEMYEFLKEKYKERTLRDFLSNSRNKFVQKFLRISDQYLIQHCSEETAIIIKSLR